MTEERLGEIIENAVEGVADKFDKGMEKAWKFRPVRFIEKTFSIVSGLGLMVVSFPLAEKGHELLAKICFISGIVVVVVESLILLLFKRK